MATTNNRRPQPGRVTGETIALFLVLGLVMVLSASSVESK